MTTLERLHRKGVLERRKDGRAFLYRPVSSREQMESGLSRAPCSRCSKGTIPRPILSFFVEEVSRQDQRLLDELERLVREKRRRQEGSDDLLDLRAAITFSAFAAVTMASSALVGLTTLRGARWLQQYTPASRAALLLRLRLLPPPRRC
jgi:hypothetical protein